MSNPVIELSEKQVINVLSQFSPRELKKIIDKLFKKKLYSPPLLENIAGEASEIVKREGTKSKTVEEAIRWARSQK